jgi:ParB family chromosome partitioning protein
MQLEFHQLDRRWEHLRVREPHRQRQLLASLAESGQQTPIVVVISKDDNERYLVIDGHKRIAALRQLGRDTVEATVWPMSEAEALLLSRSQRMSPQESALEQGWLLSEMEQRFGYSLDELARRFDRSTSWVSRRLALVELLPEAVQRQVREGSLSAQIAMKYLVPVARVSADDCERMAAAFVKHRCDTRQAAQLYTAWREGSRVVRERILSEPELFLKTQRQPPLTKPAAAEQVERDLEMALAILRRAGRRLTEALPEMNAAQQEQTQRRDRKRAPGTQPDGGTNRKGTGSRHAEPGAANRDSGTESKGSEQPRDRARIEGVASDRAQSPALELHKRAGDPAEGKSRTLPSTDPGSFGFLQGESRASP